MPMVESELRLKYGIRIEDKILKVYEDDFGVVEFWHPAGDTVVFAEDPWSGTALVVPGTVEKGQPMPVAGKTAVFDEVMQDLEKRKQKGIETYGQALMTQNGRDAEQDLYEELLDAVVYLKQVMLERQGL